MAAQGQKTMTYPEYKDFLEQQLHENVQRHGPENFYGALKSDLQQLHQTFESAHKVIESNKE
jgi:hypothetical protein